MKRESIFLWKVVFGTAAVIVVASLLFFNFNNFATWAALNNPFQGQWAVVQLLDGEILYGHLSGVSGETIGLTDVYLLDKVTPESPATAAPTTPSAVSSSTDLSVMGGVTPQPSAAQSTLIPVADTPQLFIDRSSVLYFKFVSAADPALPYLH